MFAITSGKGFQMRLPNGYIVSIQFGAGNYCEGRDSFGEGLKRIHKSPDAETAVFADDQSDEFGHLKFIRPPWDAERDDVQGYQSPQDVVRLIAWAASLPPYEKPKKKEESNTDLPAT